MQAGLWDTAEGGAQIGETETIENVTVQNGRFTLILNGGGQFGPDAFSGQERWLQIAVRCPTGTGSYDALQPRQLLTAAPYAYGLVPGARMINDYPNRWAMQVIVPGS